MERSRPVDRIHAASLSAAALRRSATATYEEAVTAVAAWSVPMNHYPLDRDLYYQIRSGTSRPESANKNVQLFNSRGGASFLPMRACIWKDSTSSGCHASSALHFAGLVGSHWVSQFYWMRKNHFIAADPVKHRDAPLPSVSYISTVESHLWECIRREADRKKMNLSRP